jgi:diaminohydroxyphosphoribosylaminopyrimidine deaminase / 5-amino-6-(5-phosphoribosylamino)uracil reductase
MNFAREQQLLIESIEHAKHCPASPNRYCVGCMITTPDGEVLSTGYTGELHENWHAEQAALHKLAQEHSSEASHGAWLFTSLEPCSNRKSFPNSCAELIIAAQISTVIFCANEPTHFTTCDGQQKLIDAGITVRQHPEFLPSVQLVNQHLGNLFSS